jgi:hypothetical protein
MSEDTGHIAGKGRSENPSAQSEDRTHMVNRRQLLKGGVAASPVILTLLNRPAFGLVENSKCSWTVYLSANPSNPMICHRTRSPGYWKNHLSDWPYPFTPDTPFHEVFSTARDPVPGKGGNKKRRRSNDDSDDSDHGDHGDDGDNLTLLAILEAPTKGHPAKHAIAALLNFAAGLTTQPEAKRIMMLYDDWSIPDEALKEFFEIAAG